ncbi:MAG: redox-sensing transcriptional repressor Rex [Treponema sp.]|nr:redox-sensing transcriptional repressor Rex [Treponema sp.]
MKDIPEPAKKRLVLLKRLLAGYGQDLISSARIEEMTGWSAALVRRDVSLLEVRCGARGGYRVRELNEALNAALNLESVEIRCCIVGLGRLGQILLDSSEIEESPFKLVAGFDSNVNRTEVLRSTFPLHPTTMLEDVVKKEGIRYALLAVPVNEAQALADRLCSAGIRGIVNYTPCMLSVPAEVAVENVSLLTALENLNARD